MGGVAALEWIEVGSEVLVRLAVHLARALVRLLQLLIRLAFSTNQESRAAAVGFWIMIGLAPLGIGMALAGVAIGSRNSMLGGVILLSGLGAVVLGLMLMLFGPLAGDVDL